MAAARRFELLGMLEEFAPSPTEERNRAEMLLLVRDPGDPFSRYLYDPGHFTAAGCVLSPTGTELLLVHHIRFDRWLQPGGHIDPEDESVADAARREVIEETGVELSAAPPALFDIDVHHIPAGKGEPPHHHFDLRFLLRATAAELNAATDEINEAGWVPLGEVARYSDERSLLRMVAKLEDLA